MAYPSVEINGRTVTNCHNVTDTIVRHLQKGNRSTYLKAIEHMRKDHIHFYLSNTDDKGIKLLWVCRSLDGKISNAVPVENLSKDLYTKVQKVLKEIIHDKYYCEIRTTRYMLITKQHKTVVEPEYAIKNAGYHLGEIYKDVQLGRYLYLPELLDKTLLAQAIQTHGEISDTLLNYK